MRLADGAGACGGVILLLTYCKICAKMEDMNKEPLMDLINNTLNSYRAKTNYEVRGSKPI